MATVSMSKGTHKIQVSATRQKYYEGYGYKVMAKVAQKSPAPPSQEQQPAAPVDKEDKGGRK